MAPFSAAERLQDLVDAARRVFAAGACSIALLDEQDVQGHGLDFDGLDDSGLAETQGPGRIRAMDDPRANQQ